MIVIVAKSIIKKECLDEYKKIVRELVEKSQKEDGNISYVLHQDINNSQNFVIIEKWRDQKAINSHNKSEHFTRIVPMIGKLREFSEVSLYEEVEF